MTNKKLSEVKLTDTLNLKLSDPSDISLIESIKCTHKCSEGNTIPLSPTCEGKKKFDKNIKNFDNDFKIQNKNFETFKRRDYCFTLFNMADIRNHSDKFLKQVKYAILGLETCPDTGKLNLFVEGEVKNEI